MRIVTFILLLWLAGMSNVALALPEVNEQNAPKVKTEDYIRFVYNKISFKKVNKLSYEAFSKGFYGYLNLKEAGKVSGNALLTICDFTLSSNTKRLWIIDVQKKKVLFNTLVAHGMGSGEEFATDFSNVENSHKSSLGFYVTGEIYQGDNGYSMKLHGVDGQFNSNAYERAIVMHGADYVSYDFARDNKRIGRSHGCPAVPREYTEAIINRINNGNVLFIYHNSRDYHKKSYWLNNTIARLPAEADMLNFLPKESYSKTEETENATPNESRVIANNPSHTEYSTKANTAKAENSKIVEPANPPIAAAPAVKKRKIVAIYETYDSKGHLSVDTVYAKETELLPSGNPLNTLNNQTVKGVSTQFSQDADKKTLN